MRSTSCRRCRTGTAAEWCWSATPCTHRRTAPVRARHWRSRVRIQLARCLRDLPDAETAFAAYEGLRRARVEKITKRGARINHAKAPGPVARRMMQLMMPIMFKMMNPEKTMGWEQRYTIDWDAPVRPAAVGVSSRNPDSYGARRIHRTEPTDTDRGRHRIPAQQSSNDRRDPVSPCPGPDRRCPCVRGRTAGGRAQRDRAGPLRRCHLQHPGRRHRTRRRDRFRHRRRPRPGRR